MATVVALGACVAAPAAGGSGCPVSVGPKEARTPLLSTMLQPCLQPFAAAFVSWSALEDTPPGVQTYFTWPIYLPLTLSYRGDKVVAGSSYFAPSTTRVSNSPGAFHAL